MKARVEINVPDGEICNGCDFITKTISLYSEPECILFKSGALKYVHRDKYEKCDECKALTNIDED